MKRFLMVAIVAAALLVTSTVQAADYGLYFAARGGYGIVMDVQDDTDPDVEFSLDPGYNVSLAAGVNLGFFRAEGEIAYSKYDFDEAVSSGGATAVDGDVTALRIMANLYYDITLLPIVSPYIGLGLGVLESDAEGIISGTAFEEKDTEFAFQIMVGAGFELSDELIVEAGYRFFSTTEFDEDVIAHDLVIGVRYMLF